MPSGPISCSTLVYRPRRPSGAWRKHAAIDRFVTPEEFASYEQIARAKGFLMVSSSPLTRSSHHAGADFERLRAARAAELLRAVS